MGSWRKKCFWLNQPEIRSYWAQKQDWLCCSLQLCWASVLSCETLCPPCSLL
jgi:hypothetical protein